MGSILSQEGVELDVTIVDDASTDSTPKVCEGFASDSRVKIVRHETNQGAIATYNDGLRRATGKYCTLISADDIITPGALKRAVDVMEHHPSVGLVYGPHVCIDERGLVKFGMGAGSLPIPRRVGSGYRLYPKDDWQRMVCQSGRCFLIGSEAIVRTSIQKAAGYYDPAQPHAGDAEMWLRLSGLADVAYVLEDQLFYRVHPGSMQMTVHSGFRFDLEERRRAFQQAFGRGFISTQNLVAAERAIDRILATGNGNWWHREITERLRHRRQRAIGVTAS
jgi:glycosyltransferase involved in cell wall biosynthesis